MDRKDYEEPRCPMDNSMWVERKTIPVPLERILKKEDEHLSRNDYAAAEKHLLYWLCEAENEGDLRGKLALLNELMGLYRKRGSREKAEDYAVKAVKLAEELGLQETITGATTFLNCGTVYKAFGQKEKSLQSFEKAKEIYERYLDADDMRRAGLYNNMALTLTALGRFSEARQLYRQAVRIAGKENPAEEAITWLNLADCATAENGPEASEMEVQACLERAEQLLEAVPEEKQDGAYAYACEKCAPVFDHYGWFAAAQDFADRAARLYAGC